MELPKEITNNLHRYDLPQLKTLVFIYANCKDGEETGIHISYFTKFFQSESDFWENGPLFFYDYDFGVDQDGAILYFDFRCNQSEPTKRQKKWAWTAMQGKCGYCNIELSPFDYSIDHIHPRSKGGDHATWNLVLACRSCNSSKGVKDVYEYAKYKFGDGYRKDFPFQKVAAYQ